MTQEEAQKAYEEAMRRAQAEQVAQQLIIAKMQRQAAERQALIDAAPRQKYAIIAAVDVDGGFGKDGKIPWDYPEDFRWFQSQTKGNICVMGKTTYLEINEKMGDKGESSVLPDRKCFVVSSTLEQSEVKNAIVIRSIYDVDLHLDDDDIEKTVFFIGGEQIFSQAISRVDRVVITAINNSFGCDRFFPTSALDKLFRVNKVFKSEHTNDLRFVDYIRR